MQPNSPFPRLALLLACLLGMPLAGHAEVIETVQVARAAVATRHLAEGVVEAVASATVAAQVQGRIVDMRVDAGDRVTRGQVLLRIDASEAQQSVAAAAANVAGAQAADANARAEWERTQALFARKFVSQAVVDQAQTGLRVAEANLRAAQAGRGQAVVAREFTTLTAPFDGIVAARLAEAGDMAQPGRGLVSIYAPGAMRVVAQVPQSVLGQLGGDALTAEIELPALDRRFAAAAVTVLPAADPLTHTVEVRALVPAGAAVLVPGQFARLRLLVGRMPRLTVPAATVMRRGEVTAVYVQSGEGFRLRQIRPGEAVEDGRIEVLAGLNEGEVVALDPIKASLQRKP
jgi:RND family efflux transporter MFP subunit